MLTSCTFDAKKTALKDSGGTEETVTGDAEGDASTEDAAAEGVGEDTGTTDTGKDGGAEDVPADKPDDDSTSCQVNPECLNDGHCDDGDECTGDTCNQDTCKCQHLAVPGCIPTPCEAQGGFCAQPTPEPEGIVCGQGFMPSRDPLGCIDQVCCLPQACAGAGEFVPVMPDAKQCCPGLQTIPTAEISEDGTCMFLDGAALCSDCGNGSCEEWENVCNCPEDCQVGPNSCDLAGGLCTIPLPDQDGDGCPDNMAPVWLAGCGLNEICCVPTGPETECQMFGGLCVPWTPDYGDCPMGTGPSGYMCETKNEVCCVQESECVPEGGTTPVVPNAPECCPGLTPIPPAVLDPASGACSSAVGASICANCGDGACQQEWENICNCPMDCALPPMECYGPMQPCPEGTYCQYPNGTCDLLGGTGKCVQIPFACDQEYKPVCGCDGQTYGNLCELHAAQMSMNYQGQCVENCLGLGESFTDFNTDGKCCPGLVPSNDCIMDEQGCACPNCPCYKCLECGDGICGMFEHQCNCPQDCSEPQPQDCNIMGGKCSVPLPGDMPCPAGSQPVWMPGCPQNQICCMPM